VTLVAFLAISAAASQGRDSGVKAKTGSDWTIDQRAWLVLIKYAGSDSQPALFEDIIARLANRKIRRSRFRGPFVKGR